MASLEVNLLFSRGIWNSSAILRREIPCELPNTSNSITETLSSQRDKIAQHSNSFPLERARKAPVERRGLHVAESAFLR